MSTKLFGTFLFLLMTISNPLFASEQMAYKDWIFKNKSTYKSVMTTNSDQQELGIICKEKCLVYFSPVESCYNQSTVGYLITTTKKSLKLAISCVEHEMVKFFILEEFKDIYAILISNEELYFLTELNGQRVEVSKFSLKGAREAIRKLFSYAPHD